MAKHHGFHTTTVRHHKDGSKTIHHQHEDPSKSIEHAVADHDAMMDSMQQHLGGGGGEEGEEAMEAGAAGPGMAAA